MRSRYSNETKYTTFSIHFYISSIRRYILIVATRMPFSECTARFMPRANAIGPACALGETRTHSRTPIWRPNKREYMCKPWAPFPRSISALRHRNISDDAGGSWLPVSPLAKRKNMQTYEYEPSNENMAMWRLRGDVPNIWHYKKGINKGEGGEDTR